MPPPDENDEEGQPNTEETKPTISVSVNGDGGAPGDMAVTYFVDEDGRYYYQPAGDSQNLYILPASAITEESEATIPNEEEPFDEDGNFGIVTLVPSDSGTGEVSYVLVVQEETKSDLRVKKIKSGKEGDEVYSFEVECDDDQSDDEVGPTVVKQKRVKRKAFTCSFCPYTSSRRYLLLRHIKSHSDERPFKCSICERGFKTVPSLQNHLNMHNGVKPHICKYCSTPFTTSGELVRHVRYKHTHEKPHKCNECEYASVELSKLRRHMRCHTGERPYQCPNCTYASPDVFKLKRHLRTHTGEKPYKCEHCNMTFTQSNSLKAHNLIHAVANKPVFACELCPAKCGRKTDLRIHVQKLHTSDKPVKCKRCGKMFPDRYSCKVHNKTHEGEKCYKCELCPYAATTVRHLRSHMLKHTDEKPFACDQCDQSFRQKQLLRRHQNLYHDPQYVPPPAKEKSHTCKECQRTFAHKGNLIRHLAMHDPESGYREQALALKLGRQKKIKSNEENSKSDSPKEDNLVTAADGQQYVVLEVVHMGEANEQQELEAAESSDDEDSRESIKNRKSEIKMEKGVNNCFGFDAGAERSERSEESYDDSAVLRLV